MKRSVFCNLWSLTFLLITWGVGNLHSAPEEVKPQLPVSTQLTKSIRLENFSVFNKLLESSAIDIEAPDKAGFTPLGYACLIADLKWVKPLVRAGADVNLAGPNGATPLGIAAREAAPELVSYLLSHGAELPRSSSEEWDPIKAAILAGSAQTAELLVKAGARLPRAGEWKSIRTPTRYSRAHKRWDGMNGSVYYSVQHDHVEMLEFLLKQGVPADEASILGYTPLMLACNYPHRSQMVCALLSAGADPLRSIKTLTEHTPKNALEMACKTGQQKIFNAILESLQNPTQEHLERAHFTCSAYERSGFIKQLKEKFPNKTIFHTCGQCRTGTRPPPNIKTYPPEETDTSLAPFFVEQAIKEPKSNPGLQTSIAILADDQLLNYSAALTARLGQQQGLTLLDREDLGKIYDEQQLQHILSLDQKPSKPLSSIGAEMLLLLRAQSSGKQAFLEVLAISSATGCMIHQELFASNTSIEDITERISNSLPAAIARSKSLNHNITTVSILGIQASTSNVPYSASTENLIAIALRGLASRTHGIAPLSPRQLSKLALEHDLGAKNQLWGSGWFIEGNISKPSDHRDNLKLTLILKPAQNSGKSSSHSITVEIESYDKLAQGVDAIWRKILDVISSNTNQPVGGISTDAKKLYQSALWSYHAFKFEQAKDYADSAYLAGLRTPELATLRINCITGLLASRHRFIPPFAGNKLMLFIESQKMDQKFSDDELDSMLPLIRELTSVFRQGTKDFQEIYYMKTNIRSHDDPLESDLGGWGINGSVGLSYPVIVCCVLDKYVTSLGTHLHKPDTRKLTHDMKSIFEQAATHGYRSQRDNRRRYSFICDELYRLHASCGFRFKEIFERYLNQALEAAMAIDTKTLSTYYQNVETYKKRPYPKDESTDAYYLERSLTNLLGHKFSNEINSYEPYSGSGYWIKTADLFETHPSRSLRKLSSEIYQRILPMENRRKKARAYLARQWADIWTASEHPFTETTCLKDAGSHSAPDAGFSLNSSEIIQRIDHLDHILVESTQQQKATREIIRRYLPLLLLKSLDTPKHFHYNYTPGQGTLAYLKRSVGVNESWLNTTPRENHGFLHEFILNSHQIVESEKQLAQEIFNPYIQTNNPKTQNNNFVTVDQYIDLTAAFDFIPDPLENIHWIPQSFRLAGNTYYLIVGAKDNESTENEDYPTWLLEGDIINKTFKTIKIPRTHTKKRHTHPSNSHLGHLHITPDWVYISERINGGLYAYRRGGSEIKLVSRHFIYPPTLSTGNKFFARWSSVRSSDHGASLSGISMFENGSNENVLISNRRKTGESPLDGSNLNVERMAYQESTNRLLFLGHPTGGGQAKLGAFHIPSESWQPFPTRRREYDMFRQAASFTMLQGCDFQYYTHHQTDKKWLFESFNPGNTNGPNINAYLYSKEAMPYNRLNYSSGNFLQNSKIRKTTRSISLKYTALQTPLYTSSRKSSYTYTNTYINSILQLTQAPFIGSTVLAENDEVLCVTCVTTNGSGGDGPPPSVFWIIKKSDMTHFLSEPSASP